MKTQILSLWASGLSLATAHYTFSTLWVNDEQVGSDWSYVREHTRGYMPTKFDEILSNDFRCQPGGDSGANTDVYAVKAGDKIALRQAFGADGIEHPGPVQVYMSRAPGDDVKSYDGSGDWFKVSEQLLCADPSNDGILTESWCIWGDDRIEFTLPARIPAGEYLVRVEHIAIHGAHVGEAEFYYACAQVKVEDSGKKTWAPTRTVKIPGVYAVDDEAINFSIWNSAITEYGPTPGPKVIIGGQVRGATNGMTDAIVKVVKRSLSGAGSIVARAAAIVRA